MLGSEGDAFFVVFESAGDAAAAAAEAQRALAEHDWPDGNEIRVRMGLHTGEPRPVDGSYVGLDVHQAARVMAAGHGGQVLVSEATRALLGEESASATSASTCSRTCPARSVSTSSRSTACRPSSRR